MKNWTYGSATSENGIVMNRARSERCGWRFLESLQEDGAGKILNELVIFGED